MPPRRVSVILLAAVGAALSSCQSRTEVSPPKSEPAQQAANQPLPQPAQPLAQPVVNAPPLTLPTPPTVSAEVSPLTPDADGFAGTMQPFLNRYCLACHGPQVQEGKFRVDQQLPNDFLDLTAKGKWGEVVNVLNSHSMPPEGEPQPTAENVAAVVDWITQQMAQAELHRRDSAIVLRRLNRVEYRNTIRDLVGVDYDVSGFPEDASAGGFDNNGHALNLSPLQLELYYNAAREILDEALVEGVQPPKLTWRFQPDSGDSDSNRVTYDGQRLIVNGGNNPVQDGFKVLHHENWDKGLNVRDFALPHGGQYIIRIRAAGYTPTRSEVVASAEKILARRRDQQNKERPQGERWHNEQYERDVEHFETDRMYDYGPPRLKLIRDLGGQPEVIAEFDVPAPVNEPGTYEIITPFTTQRAGVTVRYAYDIPRELENFWMQSGDEFARPELWVDWFELEGPVYASWPPPGHQRILFDSPNQTNERVYAREVIARFMERAWRRPVTGAEVDAKLKLFDLVRPEAPSFVQAIKTPLSAVLISPHFLYLSEPGLQSVATEAGDTPHQPRPLNDWELASRLSYFLWSTMPDDELWQLAAAGRLQQPAVLAAQVDRLLKDPRSEQFVKNFAGQWLGLREVGANPPAADLYPRYDRHLEISIVRESEAFFGHILRNDLDALNLVKSDFVVINERLGRYYGIPDVRGDHFRAVPVPENVQRGGVVTQAAMLTITSNGTRTSPVKRGTWVMKNVLGLDPGLPVANAGEIAPKVPGIDKATVRQRLEIHRTLAQCARCHNKIDPLGFGLENFNAAGEWREREGFGYKGRIGDNDPLIDASARWIDGTEFTGVSGLQSVLMQESDLFLNCLAGKLLTYALGRELGVADQIQIKAAAEYMQHNRRTLRSLIQFIVATEAFRTK